MFLTQAVAHNRFPSEIKKTVQSPYMAMSEAELLQKLEVSRKHADEGKYRDADDVISDMREKYGIWFFNWKKEKVKDLKNVWKKMHITQVCFLLYNKPTNVVAKMLEVDNDRKINWQADEWVWDPDYENCVKC